MFQCVSGTALLHWASEEASRNGGPVGVQRLHWRPRHVHRKSYAIPGFIPKNGFTRLDNNEDTLGIKYKVMLLVQFLPKICGCIKTSKKTIVYLGMTVIDKVYELQCPLSGRSQNLPTAPHHTSCLADSNWTTIKSMVMFQRSW